MRVWSALVVLPVVAVATTVSAHDIATVESMNGDVLAAFNYLHEEHAVDQPPILRPVAPRVIHNGERGGNQIALTFDACSTWAWAGQDRKVVKILRSSDTPATLFLGGRWMAFHDQATVELHDDPRYEIANHGYAHRDMPELDDAELERELGFTQLIAHALTGEMPRYFRAPYVRIDDRVVEQAARQGMATIQYDIASGDADKNLSPERVAEHVLERARPGSIVVMHMNNPALPTSDALPLILEGLREKGLEPVTVGELLGER